MGIADTPFTVVVSLPEHEHMGNYRVRAIEEIHRSHVKGTHFNSSELMHFAATKASNNIHTILFNDIHFPFLRYQQMSEIILCRMLHCYLNFLL